MNSLEVREKVQHCAGKLEFIEHFFAFVPLQDTDIPQSVCEGLCSILRDIITDLEHIADDKGPKKEVSEAGKEDHGR